MIALEILAVLLSGVGMGVPSWAMTRNAKIGVPLVLLGMVLGALMIFVWLPA